MRTILYTAIGIALLAATVTADDFIRLADEIQIPLPEGWELGPDTGKYPFQLVHRDPGAELLIHRTEISQDESLHSEQELKESVEFVIEDLILKLPEARLLTSSGYYENYRTGFVLDFLSKDHTGDGELRHRFIGVIYRHPDGPQLMFTLWAKAAASQYDEVANSIQFIQSEFAYTGPYMDEVLAPKQFSLWYFGLIPLILIGILKIFRRHPKPKAAKPRRQQVKV